MQGVNTHITHRIVLHKKNIFNWLLLTLMQYLRIFFFCAEISLFFQGGWFWMSCNTFLFFALLDLKFIRFLS
jgi:K+ transporter